MADFDDLREPLAAHAARSRRGARRADARRALGAAAPGSTRGATRAPATARARASARGRAARRREAAARDAAARASASSRRGVEAARVESFGRLADPREAIGRLDDRLPDPAVPAARSRRASRRRHGRRPQLWVRVYPGRLPRRHVRGDARRHRGRERARATGPAIWRAGGVEAGERAAWRGLVAQPRLGPGGVDRRDTYLPLNPGERPAKADADRRRPRRRGRARRCPPPSRTRVARLLGGACWRADGDAAGEAAARAALEAAVGAARAAELVERDAARSTSTTAPAPPLTRGRRRRQRRPFVVLPRRPTTRKRDVVDAARRRADAAARALRAARLRGRRHAHRARSASRCPSPLVVGPDPSRRPDEQLRQRRTATLAVPDELRWMVDFERAVADGHGLPRRPRRRRRRAAASTGCSCSACGSSADAEQRRRPSSRRCSSTTATAAAGFSLRAAGHADQQHRGGGAGLRPRRRPRRQLRRPFGGAAVRADDRPTGCEARRAVARRGARHRPGACSHASAAPAAPTSARRAR